MTTNILDPSALMAALPSLLPAGNTLNSPQDAIAALLHTAFITLSFRFISLDEAINASGSDSNVLPTDWNKNGPGYYSFKYKHDQSSLDFLLKVCKLGKRTVINAIALQTDKLVSLDVSTEDFTSMSYYPVTLETTQPLVHGFISSNRVSDLISLFKLNIITKLIPGLQKEGYSEAAEPSSSSGSRPPESSNPQREPPPERDPYPYRQPETRPPRSPLEIGRRDLDPFPSNPFGPPSLFPPDGDGMFVGPNHPIFGGRSGNSQPIRGPWGGDGYLPPLGAPPGARFDPVVPGVGPLGRGSRRRPHQEPDNDEFMPPGMGDSFM